MVKNTTNELIKGGTYLSFLGYYNGLSTMIKVSKALKTLYKKYQCTSHCQYWMTWQSILDAVSLSSFKWRQSKWKWVPYVDTGVGQGKKGV